jgi:hypothetical protein
MPRYTPARRPRSQPRIPGVRRSPVSTAVTKEIERHLQQEMRRYGVSRSFVIANALAFVFDIEVVEDYRL